MIICFAWGWAVRLWLVVGLVLVSLRVISHLFQPPLPLLLYSQDNVKSLYVMDADCPSLLFECQREQKLLDGLNGHPVAQWSPDGAYIAVSMADAWLIYQSDCLLANLSCKPVALDGLANDTRIAWGPGGTTVAYMTSESDTTMHIRTRGCWDGSPPRTCLEQKVQVASKGALRQPTWAEDGRRIAFLGLQPRALFVLDANCLDDAAGCEDQAVPVVTHLWPVFWPTLSADGEALLYFAETADGVEQLYITDLQTNRTRQVSFQAGGSTVPAWSADGRFIAFAGFHSRSGGDLGIYVLDLERGLVAPAIRQHGQDFAYPAWSP